MPAWFLLFSLAIYRWFEIASLIAKRAGSEENISYICLFVAISLLMTSSHWLTQDYDYYGNDSKSDFRSVAHDLDGLDLPDDAYIIAAPNPEYWNQYFQRMGSEETVDFGRYGAIGGPAYTYIAVNQPPIVVYALGHNPEKFYDQNLVTFLEENHDYNLTYQKEYFESSYYIFERGEL